MNIDPASQRPIKLLALVEATTVTGAAKSLLDFCRAAQTHAAQFPTAPRIETSIVTFSRRDQAARQTHSHAQVSPTDAFTAAAPANEFVTAAQALGLEVDLIPEGFRFDLRVLAELRRIVARRGPDIVLTNHVKSHFLLRLSGLKRQHPWVAYHHGYTTTNLKMRAYNQLDRWSLPAADCVITVCEAFARELADLGVPRTRIAVRHNSISPEPPPTPAATQAVRARLGVRADEAIVLAIGRLSREKAHADLIAAFAHLQRTHAQLNARLIIIGDGPERPQLEAAAAACGVGARIVFTGQLSDVRAYYAVSDVLALPSHSEGSPYVLLEAMAAGLPVVATAVGGVPEMVTHEESALLVPAHAPQALAASIARVLGDKELARKLRANAATLIATRYAPATYLHALAQIYGALLGRAA